MSFLGKALASWRRLKINFQLKPFYRQSTTSSVQNILLIKSHRFRLYNRKVVTTGKVFGEKSSKRISFDHLSVHVLSLIGQTMIDTWLEKQVNRLLSLNLLSDHVDDVWNTHKREERQPQMIEVDNRGDDEKKLELDRSAYGVELRIIQSSVWCQLLTAFVFSFNFTAYYSGNSTTWPGIYHHLNFVQTLSSKETNRHSTIRVKGSIYQCFIHHSHSTVIQQAK